MAAMLGKLETSLQGAWRRFSAWLRANGVLLAVTLAAGLAAHFLLWANGLQNPDSLWIGSVYFADGWDYLPNWELSQGRWLLALIDALRGGLNTPPLTALPALACYALGAVLAADLLDLRGAARVFAPLLLVCSPHVWEILTYRYCCASYGLAFLLAVCAAACVRRPGVRGAVCGAACLALALGLYQAVLAAAAALCLMLLILRILRGADGGARALPMLGMGAGGVAVYYALTRILQAARGVEQASYRGGDGFSLAALPARLPAGLAAAYKNTFVFFFGRDIAQNSYAARPFYALLFAAGAAALLWWAVKTRPAARALAGVLAALALLPAAMGVTDLIVPENEPALRMACGWVLAAPFALAVLQAAGLPRLSGRGALCAVLALGLLRAYVLQVNADDLVMLEYKNRGVAIAQQVSAVLPTDGTPVMVAGWVPGGHFDADPAVDTVDSLARQGLFWSTIGSNRDCWANFFAENLGLRPNWCEEAQFQAIAQSDAYAAMPCWPEDGSAALLDGVFVVKISDFE